jgi:hypothetical protein
MRENGMHMGYWWEIQKERDHVGGWTILKGLSER